MLTAGTTSGRLPKIKCSFPSSTVCRKPPKRPDNRREKRCPGSLRNLDVHLCELVSIISTQSTQRQEQRERVTLRLASTGRWAAAAAGEEASVKSSLNQRGSEEQVWAPALNDRLWSLPVVHGGISFYSNTFPAWKQDFYTNECFDSTACT